MQNKPLHETTLITCWSTSLGRHVHLTLDHSIAQCLDEWGPVDYQIEKSMFDDDTKGVKALMKKLGYKPLHGTTFRHYKHNLGTLL